MGTRLRTVVDSLCIVDGVWQEGASNVGVVEGSRIIPTRVGRGNLYALVETVGSFPDHARVQQQIIQVVQDYYRTSGSITAGIREAIKAANAALFDLNLNAPREQRGIAGITCMVLKDQDAYVGQVGPALLCHASAGKCEHFPAESTWLSSEKLQDVDITKNPPLGLRRDIEPQLFHVNMGEGAVFILSSTSLVKVASNDEIASAVTYRGAHTVRENIEAMAGGRDLSLLIVEVLSAEQVPAQMDEARARSAAKQPSSLWARASSVLRRLFAAEPEAQETREPAEEFPSEEREPASLAPGFDFRGAFGSAWRGLTGAVRGVVPLLARVLPEADAGQRVRRQKAGRVQAGKAAGGDRRWLWLVLAVPVVVLLLVAVTRFQYQRSRQAHFDQLVKQVQEARAGAEASSIAAEKRARLAEALALLAEAQRVKPEEKTLAAPQTEIQDALDKVNNVYRLIYFAPLQEFADTTAAKSYPSAVLVHGIDVYVLDTGTDRVYKYLLNPSRDGLQNTGGEPVLVRKGDQHGDVVVDELLDIAWADPGTGVGGGSLLILDKKGHLLRYDPSAGITSAPVANSGAWRDPVAVSTFYANLYVLDPAANRLLKYEPTATGYDAAPTDYFKPDANANVSNAVDVSIDGNVYVLRSDGTISKYIKGASDPFENALDEPLKGPCCVFASDEADKGYVYVIDGGNQRIVKLSKKGEFIRQYRSREPDYMSQLRAVFVDEVEKKLYLVDGSKLYLVNIPD